MKFARGKLGAGFVSLVLGAPCFAQSFTGAEFGTNAGNYEAENAEAEAGLENATPTDNGQEIGDYGADYSSDYGDYGNAVGNYGLGEASVNGAAPNANYGNYGAGETNNIFGSQYDNYESQVPLNPPVENPAATQPVQMEPVQSTPFQTVPTGTYNQTQGTYNAPAPFNNPAAMTGTDIPAIPSQPDQLLMEAAAAESNPVTVGQPNPTVLVPVAPVEDGSQYYPVDDGPGVPVAPPLPLPNEFSGAPPVPGSMRIMADGEAPEEYVVEPGDTLFDVCDQLLDEPAYWPKLWALNPEIKNPHFIYPGMKLRFYPGTEESPPYLQVVAEEDVIPIDKGELDESQLILEPIQFVTEEYDPPEVVNVIGSDQVQVGDDIVISGGAYPVVPVQMRIPGFIYPEEKESLGYVRVGRQGEVAAIAGTRVFFEQEAGLSPGSTYTVLRYAREVENPQTGDFVGYLYYWVGNVKIERTVESDFAAGIFTESRLSARDDDILVEFISTNRQTPADYSVAGLTNVNANIVGFGEEVGELGAQGQFVFLDTGSGGGVSPGMNLPIYSTPRAYLSRNLDLGAPKDYEQVGVIRVLDATPAGAVGLIVQSTDAIRIGDRTDKG